MESVLNVNVTKYKSVKDRSKPMEVNLWEVLSDKTPSKTIDKLRELMPRTPQNELERQTVKIQLEAITVNANYFNGAAKQDNPNYKETGLMFIDIDGKDNLHIKCMEKLKADLSKIANIAYIELSCSGDGLHVLMPILTPKDLSAHYEAVNDHFKRLGIVIDKQVKGVTRLKYLSKDPFAFVRHDAIPYAAILNSEDRQSQEQFNDSMERYGKKKV